MPSSTSVLYSGILYFEVTFGLQILGGTLIKRILGLLNKCWISCGMLVTVDTVIDDGQLRWVNIEVLLTPSTVTTVLYPISTTPWWKLSVIPSEVHYWVIMDAFAGEVWFLVWTNSAGAKSIDFCKPVEDSVRESRNEICIALECDLLLSKSRVIFQSFREGRTKIKFLATE